MVNNALLLLLIIPLIASVISVGTPKIVGKVSTFLALTLNMILAIIIYSSNPENIVLYGEIIFSVNRLGLFALLFIQIMSFVILLFALKGVNKEIEKRFFVLYGLTVSFCNGVVISEHALMFIIFWGLSGLTLYLFGTLGNTLESPRTAKKTFIIIGGSDALLIMGFIIIWLLNNSQSWSIHQLQLPVENTLQIVAFMFLLIAAFAKAGGFPFHTWVPDFAKDAPIESAALLPASLDKILGIYLLALIMTTLFTIPLIVNMIVISLGTLTVITAVMMAMNQHNGRKLLGYHAVSQVGYMIIGIGSGTVLAFAGGLFHLINHTMYKSNLFLSLGAVEKKTNTSELDYLGGLGKKMPLTFIMALVGALSISGIPPFNGFFSKWMIYQGLIEKTAAVPPVYQIWLLVCIVLAVFGSALTLASFMKFLHAIFLGRRPSIYDNVKEAPFNQWLSTGILSALCLIFGVFAIELPLYYFILPVAKEAGFVFNQFTGLYTPKVIVSLFLITFALGYILYLLIRKVRYDQVYLGGSAPSEKFKVTGTAFYNEIRNMSPLRSIYDMAEKKYFDLYELGSKGTFALSSLFQKAHPGQLQLYLLYMLIGLLILLILM